MVYSFCTGTKLQTISHNKNQLELTDNDGFHYCGRKILANKELCMWCMREIEFKLVQSYDETIKLKEQHIKVKLVIDYKKNIIDSFYTTKGLEELLSLNLEELLNEQEKVNLLVAESEEQRNKLINHVQQLIAEHKKKGVSTQKERT